MCKRTYKCIQIQTRHNSPNYIAFNVSVCSAAAHKERIHTENEENIKQVSYNLYLFLTPFSDAKRSKEHTPKGSVSVYGCNNSICTLRASAAIVTKPVKNICISCFEEAEPASKRNNPEILILCNLTKCVLKLNLDNVSFRLNNLFLCICINDEDKKRTDNTDNGKCYTVNTNIGLVGLQRTGNKRNNNVIYGGTERINYTLYRCNISSLLRIRRKNVNKILICVIEEVIEELQNNVEQKNNCTFCYICCILAEDFAVTYNKVELIIREPNHHNKEDGARNTHPKQIRSVLTRFISGIIDNISS